MPYLVQYKSEIGTLSGEKVVVTIYQTSSFAGSGTPTVTSLIPSGSEPFKITVIDNDSDPFKTIRGQQATINFLSQPGITAKTFSTGPDDEWLVEAVVESSGFILFNGYLVMDDHEGKFLPPTTYEVTLTATDNLGTLKDVDLSDETGAYITGYHKIIYYLSQALRKTNLQLDIIVTDTWMEENTTGFLPACDQIYLEAKTFEVGIRKADNCYSVLDKLLKFNSTIFQYNGQWWISHIDERNQNDVYQFRFDYTGTYISQLTTVPFNNVIGKTQPIKLINADATTKEVRPNKSVQINFNYEFPQEIIDNIDFSRGTTLYTPLDMSNETVDGVSYYVSKYHIDDWTLKAGTFVTPATPTRTAYIKKLYLDSNKTYEKEGYVVIEDGSTTRHWLESNPLPVLKNDKFVISVDFRITTNLTGSADNLYGVGILLIAEDGTKYVYGQRPSIGVNQWVVYIDSVDMDRMVYTPYNRDYTDETTWNSLGGDIPPAPASGQLYIRLPHYNGADIHYSNLQFTYTPFINGDYSKYDGFSVKVSQSGNYKATVSEQVYITDSQIKIAKGSMFRKVGSNYILTKGWFAGGDLYRQGIVPPFPPSSTYIHPYYYLQAYALWNKYNRPFMQLSGTVNGILNDAYDVPGLNTNYTISTTTGGADTKSFIVTTSETNHKADQAKIYLVETEDSTAKDYTSPIDFKYKGGVA